MTRYGIVLRFLIGLPVPRPGGAGWLRRSTSPVVFAFIPEGGAS